MTIETREGSLVVVELLGLPGAGKTTVGEVLALSSTIEVMSRVRGIANVPAYSAAALRLAPAFARAGRWNRCSWRDRNKMIRLESSLSVARRQARRGAEAFVFVQGPLFIVEQLDRGDGWGSSASGTRRNEVLRRLGETLDLALVLDAPDDLLLQRIRGRNKSHALQDASDDVARRSLDLLRRSFDLLIEEVRRYGTVRTQRIDTSASSVGATAAAVLRSITAISGSRPSNLT